MKKLNCLITVFMLAGLTACAGRMPSPDSTEPGPATATVTAISSPKATNTIVPQTTPDPKTGMKSTAIPGARTPAQQPMSRDCQPDAILISENPVRSFDWAPDSRAIFFQEESSGFAYRYNLDRQQTVRSPVFLPSPTPEQVVPAVVQGFPRSQISLSPSGSRYLYYAVDSYGPKATPQIEGETSGPFQDVINTLYHYDQATKKVNDVGAVHGRISQIVWAPTEKTALVIMQTRAPVKTMDALVLLADLENFSLKQLVPANFNGVAGVSPDGQKVLYYQYHDHMIRVVDTVTFKEELLIPTVQFLWWEPDSQSFIYLLDKSSAYDENPMAEAKTHRYDLRTKQSSLLSEALINYQPNSTSSVKISDDYQKVAYIEEETHSLKYIHLCKE